MTRETPKPTSGSRDARDDHRRKKRGRTLLVVALAGTLAVSVLGVGALRRDRRDDAFPEIPAAATNVPTVVNRLREARLKAVHTGDAADLAELARLLHANGYLREAETCWRRLTILTPGDPEAWHLLADLRRLAGDNDEASRLLAEVLRLKPDYAPACLHLGNLALKRGALDEADRQFVRRLELLPNDPHALLGRLRVEQQRGREAEAAAAALAQRLARDHPRFAPGHNLYAEYLAQRGDTAGARWHRWLGREAGRFREAEDPWVDRLSAWCFDPKRLGVLGTVAYQTGRLDEARPLLEKAIALTPSSAAGYELLGDLALQQADIAGAIRTLTQGVQRSRPHTPVSLWVALGEAHRMAGNAEAALRVTEEALLQLPSAPELQAARGVALLDLGRAPEALVALDLAIEAQLFDAQMLFNRALALIHLERIEEAVDSLERALRVQPTFPKALALLAEVEMSRENLAAAEPHLRALYDAYPGMQEPKRLLREWHLQNVRLALRRGDDAAARFHREAAQAWALATGPVGGP